MVPICPPIKELLTGLLGAIAAVNILGIVELFQDAVVPALLLEDDRPAAMLGVKHPHDEGIIHMTLGNVHGTSYQPLKYSLMASIVISLV